MPNWKKVIVSGSNAILNNITASGNFSALDGGVTIDAGSDAELIVQGQISASGLLFASLSYDSTPVTNGVVVYDTSSGQFYYTGSYGGGSGVIEGTDTQVLYFNGDDNPEGHSGFTYDNTTEKISVGGGITHLGDPNTEIAFASDTIIFKGNNVQLAKFNTTQLEFNKIVTSETDANFLSGNTLLFNGVSGNARSGFRESAGKAYTFITPQPYQDKFAVIGMPMNIVPGQTGPGAYPYNYVVLGQNATTFTYGGNGGGPGPVPDEDDVGLLTVKGSIIVEDWRSDTGSGDPSGGVKISGNPSILFFNGDATTSISRSFFNDSASAEIKFDTGSSAMKFFVGSTKDPLKEVMFISKSGDNPRIGIGVSSPLKAFDFKEVRDDARGGELLIRGSRTTKGAEDNDEVGRINFSIDSSSYGDITTSGSAAEIIAIADSVNELGVQGSLSLRVASAKIEEPIQRIKLTGYPIGSYPIQFTGSADFDTNININGDLIIDGKIDSFITASSGISASGDIETSEDMKASNFLLPAGGGSFKTSNNAATISIDGDNIDLGFGGTPNWQLELRQNEGVVLYDLAHLGPTTYRDFRIEGNSDTHLFFVTGGDARVGIGTGTPDEKLTVNGNIKALGDIIATGNVIAENYIVSSSVTYMTQSFSSGSTIFGDTLNDTHEFTGSVDITGSFTLNGMNYPVTDGTSGQVLTTDGSGNLTFTTTTTAITASAISASYIDLDVTADQNAPDYKEGRLYYNAEDGALTVYNDEADVSLQVGQEFWVRVKNNSGGDILNGTPVRISGSQGDRPAIWPATAENHISEPYEGENHIIGVATHDILDTEEGYVTAQGIVRGVTTTAFAAGDTLYLQTGSPATPEDYYRTDPPPYPYETIRVGWATKIADPNGFIFVEPKSATHLYDISNISGSDYYANVGDLLVKQADGGFTYSKTLSGSYTINNGGLTIDNGQLTVDSLKLDNNSIASTSDPEVFMSLSTNGFSFEANSGDAIYFNTEQDNVDLHYSGEGDANLFYIDASEDKIGIGTNTPGEKLEVVGNISASGTITANGATFTGNLIVTGSQLITDDITSDGTIRARVKSFDIPHPTRKNKRLVYGALEGPEHGIYCRGESKELKVLLPPEWRAMVDTKGISVQITPIGEWQPLYFKKLHSNWLYFGCGDDREKVHFYWEIKGERTDVPKLETVQ